MSALDYVYVPLESEDKVTVLNEDDGSVHDTITITNPVNVETDIDGYIYIGSSDGSIYQLDENYNEIWSYTTEYERHFYEMAIHPTEDKKYIYAGFSTRMYKFEVGSSDPIVWENYEATNIVNDISISIDGDTVGHTCAGDTECWLVDVETGSTTDTIDPGGSSDVVSFQIHKDGYFVPQQGIDGMFKYDYSLNEVDEKSYPYDSYSSILEDEHGDLYLGNTDSGVYKFDSNMDEIWYTTITEETSLPEQNITGISIAPGGGIYVATRGGNDGWVAKLDGDTGNILWTFEDHGIGFYEDIGKWPRRDSYRSEEWFGRIEISGTTNLQDNTVENAEIIAIDDEEDELVARTQSDVDGNWSVEVPGSTIHVIAQYTDADGNLYNSESYPYVNK